MSIAKSAKQIVRLALPILFGNLSYALLGISDTVMSGMAGTSDLAGVAVGGSFFFPAIMFLNGLMSTLQPLISRLRGAEKWEEIPKTHLTAVVMTFIASLILMTILIVLVFFVIKLDADPRMDYTARYYILAIAFSIPIFALYSGCRAYCEAMGYTKATLYFGFVALILNVPLNYILIFGSFGLPALGGVGCGVATLISGFLSLVLFIIFIRCRPFLYKSTLIHCKEKLTFKDLKDFFKLSIPLGLSASVECSCFTIIALLLSPLGSFVVSSHSIAMSVTSFIFNLPLSLGIATSIAVGFSIGREDLEKLKSQIKAAYRLAFCAAFFNMFLLGVGREFFTSLYTEDPHVAAFAAVLLVFSIANQISENTQTMQAFILRGFKDSATIFKSTVLSFYVIALPVGFLLCYEYLPSPFSGAKGFWVGIFLGLTFASLYYRRRVLFHWRALKAGLKNF